jgi:hypothetical protein
MRFFSVLRLVVFGGVLNFIFNDIFNGYVFVMNDVVFLRRLDLVFLFLFLMIFN